jgi:hypothetical protein
MFASAQQKVAKSKQLFPSVRSRWPLCLNEDLGGSFLYKENGEGKEVEEKVKYKRCGVMTARNELNPRLLSAPLGYH